MRQRSIITAMPVVLLAGMICFSGPAAAQQENDSGLRPDIPEGRGDSCVAETGFMRRNHMELLKHQRDETMLKGVRTRQYSLKECLDCHAVFGPDAVPVTIESPKHFCRSCHDYAAVSIDCFQCHASRPEQGELPGGHPGSNGFSSAAAVNGRE